LIYWIWAEAHKKKDWKRQDRSNAADFRYISHGAPQLHHTGHWR